MRWAAWAGCEGHGMEAAEDWKGRAEDSGHQLVSGVRMERIPTRVTVIFSPAVFFLCAVLLWGRRHGVSGSSKRTHDLQRAWPVIPGPVFGITVSEAFGKRIAGDFQLCYSVVLIGCDGGKSGLLENKCLVIFFGVFLAVFPRIHVDHMESGLVSVH